MCKISSIILESTGCLLLLNGELAHKWTKWTYQLCREDYGYRSGACHVCDNEYRAKLNYDTALAFAQSQYNFLVDAAWRKKLEEEKDASYTIDTIPFIDRQKRLRYRHYRSRRVY
ncbi:hypothetical protein BCIN_02g01110 [Botrytis cinerea B05.10]|uniref:Uncharacterized protein n=1 Tax=Botryotinia fuckeliana (strain B05.10) TaxID=332648 RepID=A0A384J8D4_BOTFB|nr:hypothetical protein BCIN_02g01110 [Botrytis cinerea B05.10]ATZ46741.1 hypothetical protein BCIN_02g01110 [Botrytis cinerea B05.10]